MKISSKIRNDIVVIGLALFSMFFGAGNLIFPPYLAMTSGSEWFLGFLCFFAAVVMIVLSLLGPRIRNYNIHRFAVLGALIVSVIETGNAYLPYVWHMEFISKLPLSQFGFGWVVPAAVLGFVGAVVKRPLTDEKAS